MTLNDSPDRGSRLNLAAFNQRRVVIGPSGCSGSLAMFTAMRRASCFDIRFAGDPAARLFHVIDIGKGAGRVFDKVGRSSTDEGAESGDRT
jgi:hypothetical protein